MEVIPAINCPDFDCVKQKIKQIKEIQGSWVHIDVADGQFTKSVSWNKPDDLLGLEELAEINLEIHLMVEEPQAVVEDWLRVGGRRIIVHQEALGDGWPIILDKVTHYDAQIALAIKPETSAQVLLPYLDFVEMIQLLAVEPGPSGQQFNPVVLEKIKFLKKEKSNIKIEIDGGINPETAKLVKRAGADIIVSASFIFESPDPRSAYLELISL